MTPAEAVGKSQRGGMEAERQRTHWHHWILWWKIAPEELRHQVDGYDRLRSVFAVRRLGCLLAMAAAVQAAIDAWLGHGQGHASLSPAIYFQAAVALGLLVLGGFVFRGSRLAAAGLMLLYTVQLAFLAACGDGQPFRLLSLLGWSIVMHVLYLTLRVERSRKGTA